MEMRFKFIGQMKFEVGGKSELTLDVSEGCTLEEALGTLGVDCKKAAFNFAVVNGEKVDTEYVLRATDDVVKVFPRSFGG
jgi:hypothetical protein